ncbi:MAG: hypothetical protein ETSY1_20805 [Candidatus Entotheonella factor]|uniref:Acriflavin resistance protein n=1 Tax=Entotheonella factor TaxID=1429438 RepID=W4LIX8_ENTF1|nr:MAG: hypothetical protein ETSY1_20805 [Candidatus Entotheonella factor]
MLIGIAVNNGIVMIAYIQQLRQNGLGIREAALQGAVTRLRPILITTLTTTLALVPMAIGFGEGAEIWAPLGRVVAGGLCVSALFTLFFTPTLYTLLEALRSAPVSIEPVTTEAQATVAD